MKDKTSIVLAVGAAAFALAVVARFMLTGQLTRETFMQQDIGAPVNKDQEGAYNGIDISNGNSWSQTTAPTPLKPYEAANDNELFAFQNSPFKPECCPSSITADTGCLCLSASDEKSLAYRGGNRVA
jgi:hypothetical protein